MNRLLPLFALFALGGCYFDLRDPTYFPKRAESNERALAGHKTVFDEKGRLVGYVELQHSVIAGNIESHYHEDWFVKDSNYNLLGYIAENGSTYRFRRDSSEATHIGNYTVNDGIRVLLGTNAKIELRSTKEEE